MKLARLRVRNFRCFKDETSIDFDDITAIIGKNDSGKSAILEALDVFLNESDLDKDDATKGGTPEDLTIICEFTELPEAVVIDDATPTNLASEYLLNPEGRLEIHKTYNGQLKTPKCTRIEVYAIHPTAVGANDLLQLTNARLKSRATELGLGLEGLDQRSNAPIRARIRQSIEDLSLQPCLIPLMDDNAGRIWSELKKYLPIMALFKSDRESTDQDPEAQDPLKVAVREAIKAKENELAAIAEYVEKEAMKMAAATLAKLSEMDSTLATELRPAFGPLKWDTLFKASIVSDEAIPVNKRGSGVKRLILLSFFRAKAEQTAAESTTSDIIYAIEEPETSQHPNNQRMLVRSLVELSTQAQVIFSTHTPMLARVLPDSKLRYINVAANRTRQVLCGGPDTNLLFTKTLGVLPDHTVKLFVGVEGPNDMNFLCNISAVLRREGFIIPDLAQMELNGELIFIPLGGSNLVLWSNRLKDLNRPEFHLCDRDTAPPAPPKYEVHMAQVNARVGCLARSTAKKEIENYLHKDAIASAYAEHQIALTIGANFGPFDDVPQSIARLVHEASGSANAWDGLSDRDRGQKIACAKRILCAGATKHMTRTLLREIDPDDEVIQWFEDMKGLLAA